jgi:hypothetical protein
MMKALHLKLFIKSLSYTVNTIQLLKRLQSIPVTDEERTGPDNNLNFLL